MRATVSGAEAEAIVAQDLAPYIELSFLSGDAFRREFADNMRFGGLTLQSRRPYAADETVTVSVMVPGALCPVQVRGRVVQCQPQAGKVEADAGYQVALQLEAKERELRDIFREQLDA